MCTLYSDTDNDQHMYLVMPALLPDRRYQLEPELSFQDKLRGALSGSESTRLPFESQRERN